MKRLISLGLALALLFNLILLPGCSHPSAGLAADKPESSDSVQAESLSQLIPGKTAQVERVRQYGEAQSSTNLLGELTVRVEYPAGDQAALDEAVKAWVDTTAETFRSKLASQGKTGSFNGTYDSYKVNDRIVSVRMTGSLSDTYAQRGEPVVATFNYDCHAGKLFTLSNLLVSGGDAKLQQLLSEKLGEWNYGQSPLANWLLTAEALRLYLPDGTSLDLTYEELDGILSLPTIPEPEPEKDPDPQPITYPNIDLDNVYQDPTIDPSKPMIALTFDDGPYTKVTTRLLDALAKYGGRATFFVVGERVSSYADTLRRTVNEGHEIGIHTWSHANLTKLSADGIRTEVMDTYNAVLETAGFKCAVVRPPGGAHNEFVRNTIGELGLYISNWSLDTEDWRSRDADSVYNEVMSAVRDGSVVLCHDLYPSTAEAMERAIPELIAQGYQLVTISELMMYKKGHIEAGKLYNQGY